MYTYVRYSLLMLVDFHVLPQFSFRKMNKQLESSIINRRNLLGKKGMGGESIMRGEKCAAFRQGLSHETMRDYLR